MRVAVCQAPPELVPGSGEWKQLAAAVRAAQPDLFLLNEMPFGPWIAAGEEPDRRIFDESLGLHDEGLSLLGELGARMVLGTRPARIRGRDVNEAFVWTASGGVRGVHTKQYFPDEEGYYEARWFQAGDPHFRLAPLEDLRAGFLVCTEVMFNEHARRYGRQGAHLIAVPRAVGPGSLPRWLVAMRMAAIVSGCYVLSSNRTGKDSRGQQFGGCGWIVDPFGETVAQTSEADPVVFHTIDREAIARAQREYPCYVREPGAATDSTVSRLDPVSEKARSDEGSI